MSEKVYCSNCRYSSPYWRCKFPHPVKYSDDFYKRRKIYNYMAINNKYNACKYYEKYVPFFIKLFKWEKWWKV